MPATSRATERLAARSAIRQITAISRADRIAEEADQLIRGMWRRLLALLGRGLHVTELHTRLRELLEPLHGNIQRSIASGLSQQFAWSHRTITRGIIAEVPHQVLDLVATRRDRRLHEAAFEDLLQPARDRDEWDQLPKEERDRLWRTFLFAPPAQERVNAIVYGSHRQDGRVIPWTERLTNATRIAGATPERLAWSIASGYAAGRNRQQLAADLLPIVDGVRSSANRIARTEGMRVANQAQDVAYEALGDLVIGYQIHATIDHWTRSWHALRSGTVYYRNPKSGQKGYAQLPNPPHEAEDSRERPPGTPEVAPHCRCYKTPVLSIAEHIEKDPAARALFAEKRAETIPDPAIYSEWFDEQATDRQKRLAVGHRRFAAVRSALGREPDWAHFLDPSTGGLLSVETLEGERSAQRTMRLKQVRRLLAERKEHTEDVALWGFLKPNPPPAQPARFVPPPPPPPKSEEAVLQREPIGRPPGRPDIPEPLRPQPPRTKPLADAKEVRQAILDYHEGEQLRQKIVAQAGAADVMVKQLGDRMAAQFKQITDLKQKIMSEKSQAIRSQKIAEVNAVIRDHNAMADEKKAVQAAINQQAHAALKAAVPKPIPVAASATATPKMVNVATDAANWLASILHQDGIEQVDTQVKIAKATGKLKRAAYAPSTKTVELTENSKEHVAAHELGHHLEQVLPGVKDAAQAFVEYRCGAEKPQSLAKLFPKQGYTKSEMGRKDDFDHTFGEHQNPYYAGKVYSTGETEIVSMGLELLHKDPVGFARRDPEYFSFITGILRGAFRSAKP